MSSESLGTALAIGVGAAAAVATGGSSMVFSLAFVAAQTAATMLLTKKQVNEGARLEDRKITTSASGNTIPKIYGTVRTAGDIIWASEKREHKNSQTMGKGIGGGVENVTYTYTADFAILLCQNKISGVSKIFANQKLILDLSEGNDNITKDFDGDYKVYYGTEDQMPDPTIENEEGIGNVPAYKGFAYIVFKNYGLGGSGALPNFNFEVINTEENIDASNFIKEESFVDNDNKTFESTTLNYNKINNCIYSYLAYGTFSYIMKYNIDDKSIERIKRVEKELYSFNTNTTLGGTNRFLFFTNSGDIVSMISRKEVALFNKDSLDFIRKLDYKDFENITKTNLPFIPSENLMFSEKDLRYYSISADKSQNYVQILAYDVDFFGSFRRDIRLLKNRNDLRASLRTTQTIDNGSSFCYNSQKNEAYFCNYRKDYDSFNNLNRYLSLSKIRFDSFSLDENICVFIDDQVLNKEFTVMDMFIDKNNEFIYIFLGYFHGASGVGNTIIKYDINNNKKIWDVEIRQKNGQRMYNMNHVGLYENKIIICTHTNTMNMVFYYFDVNTKEIEIKQFDISNNFSVGSEYNNVIFIENENLFIGKIEKNRNKDNIYTTNKLFTDRFKKGEYKLKTMMSELISETGLDVKNEVEFIGLDEDKVNGFQCANTTTARSYLEQLAQLYNFDIVNTDWKMKFIKANQKPTLTIESDNLGVITYSSNPKFTNSISTKRTPDLELPKILNVNYLDIETDFQQNTQDAYRQTVYTDEIKVVEAPIAFYNYEAKKIAEQLMYNAWTQRDTYNFETDLDYFKVEPCDIVNLYDNKEDQFYTVKIIKKEEDVGIIKFTAVSYDPLVFDQKGVSINQKETGQKLKKTSVTETHFLDMPILRIDDDRFGFYVASAPQNRDLKWSGSALFISKNDNSSYNEILSFEKEATIGVTLNKLENFENSGIVDNINYLDVYLKTGELESISETEFLSNENIAIVGNEYILFKDAELIGKNTYRLTSLIRGRWNTKHEIKNHENSERFILVNYKTLRRNNSDFNDENLNFYKNVTFGKSLADTNFDLFSNKNKGMVAYPVFDINFNKNNNGDIYISWKKSVRGNNTLQDGIDLSDPDFDNYEIDVFDKSNNFIKTVKTQKLNHTFTNQEIIDEKFTGDFTVKIYKLNKYMNRGIEAEALIKF